MPFTITQANASAWAQEAARGVGDVIVMLRGIVTDPRVSQAAKLEASAALAYLVSGRGRIPSFIPVVGRIDNVAVAAFALRRFLASAGEPVVRSHWRGSSRGLDVLLGMAGALAIPGGRLRRLATMGSVGAAFLRRDPLASARQPRRAGRRPGAGRVVDGEVVARREDRK